MNRIGIIDYGMGNLGSVKNACRYLDVNAAVVASPAEMDACDALILPGVGAFGDCMDHLREHDFIQPIRDWIAADRPFLGICLGLQVLFSESEESSRAKGLGVIPGVIRKFRLPPEYKVPQIGWSRVREKAAACPLFAGIPDESYFYFVHSYYADAAEKEYASGVTRYGIEYASAIWRGRLTAVQFHPEKSQKVGLRMLRNFAESVQQDNVNNKGLDAAGCSSVQ